MSARKTPNKSNASQVNGSNAKQSSNAGRGRGSNLMLQPEEAARARYLSPSPTPQTNPQPRQNLSFPFEPEANLFGYQLPVTSLLTLQTAVKDYSLTGDARKKSEKDLKALWKVMKHSNLNILKANTLCENCAESPAEYRSAHTWDNKTLKLVVKLSDHFDVNPANLTQITLDEIVASFEDVEASYKMNHLDCPFTF